MPVIVNLFEELQKEEKERRKDLLATAKRTLAYTMAAGVLLGGLSWLWANRAEGLLRRVSRDWEEVGDLYEELVALNNRGAEMERQGEFLLAHVHDRILWAPILAALADKVPVEAQITKLTCERKAIAIQPDPATLVQSDGTAPATRAELEELIREKTRMVRAVQMFLEGLAYGDRAELTVDAFRTDLQQFSIGEEFTGAIRLGPLGTARLGPASGWTGEVKRFVIDCNYEEQDDGGA